MDKSVEDPQQFDSERYRCLLRILVEELKDTKVTVDYMGSKCSSFFESKFNSTYLFRFQKISRGKKRIIATKKVQREKEKEKKSK